MKKWKTEPNVNVNKTNISASILWQWLIAVVKKIWKEKYKKCGKIKKGNLDILHMYKSMLNKIFINKN